MKKLTGKRLIQRSRLVHKPISNTVEPIIKDTVQVVKEEPKKEEKTTTIEKPKANTKKIQKKQVTVQEPVVEVKVEASVEELKKQETTEEKVDKEA